jgi:hypothetical protein
MKFLIGPDQVHFSFVFGLKFFLSWHWQNIGFGAADPGIVTVMRIFQVCFDLTGLNQRK